MRQVPRVLLLPPGEPDFISAIGSVVFYFMFRTETDVDPDAVNEVDQSEAISDAEPNTHRSATCRPEPASSSQFSSQSL